MNDLSLYSEETLGSLRRFVATDADFMVYRYSRHTPTWQHDDFAQLLTNGDASREDISDSQETIYKIYLTESFRELLK